MATKAPPPVRVIARAACLRVSMVPVALSSRVSRQAAASSCWIGPIEVVPTAQATTARSGNSLAAASTAAVICSSSVTSATTYRTPSSLAACCNRVSVRPQMTTSAPSAASRRAQPRPIPLPPPVTSAAVPFSVII